MKRTWLVGCAVVTLAASAIACSSEDDPIAGGPSGNGSSGNGGSSSGSSSGGNGSSSGNNGSSSGDNGSSSGDNGAAELKAACEGIALAKGAVACSGDPSEAEMISTCVAEAEQMNGACRAEYIADASCRKDLSSSKYECVGATPTAELKLDVEECQDTFMPLYECILENSEPPSED